MNAEHSPQVPKRPERGPVRIMHLISGLEVGGGQECLRGLVKYQLRAGCAPLVCSFADGPLRPCIEEMGVRVEILPPRRYEALALPLFFLEMLCIRASLIRAVRKFRIEVVQTHLLASLDFLACSLLAAARAPAVVWTFHNSKFELNASQLARHRCLLRPKKGMYRLLYRLCFPRVSGAVAVSDEVKEAVESAIGPAGRRVSVICNGVDEERYASRAGREEVRAGLGLGPGHRLLIVVATLKEQKGHASLIQALESLAPRHPDLRALFVGDGVLREELARSIRGAGLEGRVSMLGSREDVAALLAASDLFVLPSLWEGFSIALLEAMASGLPVVATRVSGSRHVLVDGETGVLVPPGDGEALARGIEDVLVHPGKAQQMGAAGQRRVLEEFTARKQADRHIALYREVLRKGRVPGRGGPGESPDAFSAIPAGRKGTAPS